MRVLVVRSLASAFAAPLVVALAAACGGAPPPPAPAPSAGEAPDASTASWMLPEVPLANRRVVFLAPPPSAPDSASITAIAPDPPPLVEGGQWVYDLRFSKGDVFLAGVHAIQLAAPQATPRMMGRFALELYEGVALLERVRFDFPGLGANDPSVAGGRQPLEGAPITATSKLTTRVGVMLPATKRGTKLELWDRATNRRWPLPWPALEMSEEPAKGEASPVAQ